MFKKRTNLGSGMPPMGHVFQAKAMRIKRLKNTARENTDGTDLPNEDALTGFWSQVSYFLRWLNARAWPLTGILLILAYRYLWQYFESEKMPLNVLSHSAFGALPAFLLMLLFYITIAVFMSFTQTFFLFVPVLEGDNRSLVYFLKESRRLRWGVDKITLWSACRNFLFQVYIAYRNFLFGRYVLYRAVGFEGFTLGMRAFSTCVLVFYVAWAAWCLVYDRELNGIYFWAFGLVPLVVMNIHGYFDLKISIGRCFNEFRSGGYRISWRFRRYAMWAIFIQWAMLHWLAFFMYDVLGKHFSVLLVCGFLFVVVLFYVQFRLAEIVKHAGDMLKIMGAFVLGLLVLGGFVPSVSNYATGKLLSKAVAGGRSCAVLGWTESNLEVLFDIQGDSASESSPLRIMAEMDGYYLVRKFHDVSKDKINYVPRHLVASIRACTSQESDKSQKLTEITPNQQSPASHPRYLAAPQNLDTQPPPGTTPQPHK